MISENKKFIDATSMIKLWAASIVGVVVVVLGIVFWINDEIKDYGDIMFYPKLSGENTEREIKEMKDSLKIIQTQNIEIIKTLSGIEGQLKNHR